MGGGGGAQQQQQQQQQPQMQMQMPQQQQQQQQQQAPSPADQMQLAIAEALKTLVPALVTACQVPNGAQSVDIGAGCWAQIWAAVGCETARTPAYEQWHAGQSLEVLTADAAMWAALPDEKHRMGCYGKTDL